MTDLKDPLYTSTDRSTDTPKNLTAGSKPLTSRQFLSFETIAAGLFTLFVAVTSYTWSGHADDFKAVKNDVKTISLKLPTLATKAEMDEKFSKMDEKFSRMHEKTNDKLDALIVSVNQLQAVMTSNMAITNYRLDALEYQSVNKHQSEFRKNLLNNHTAEQVRQ